MKGYFLRGISWEVYKFCLIASPVWYVGKLTTGEAVELNFLFYMDDIQLFYLDEH